MPQELLCLVTKILDHGEQIYSVLLRPESPAPRFRPGQFLYLALDTYTRGDPWPDSRAFSIASAPAERQSLRITYAVKGEFTGRMEAELRAGSRVWIKMPFGDFTIRTDQEVCLLAGGTGVTAFTAFLAGLNATTRQRVHLLYGARRPDLLIYRPLVETARERCPGLHAQYFAEQDFEGTDCLPGRIEVETVWKSVPEPPTLTYYLAGPTEMIQTLTTGLKQRGVRSGQIIADAWE